MFARLLNTAKNMAAAQMLKGFHWPKIITASAKEARASHADLKVPGLHRGTIYARPPIAPSAPESSTPA